MPQALGSGNTPALERAISNMSGPSGDSIFAHITSEPLPTGDMLFFSFDPWKGMCLKRPLPNPRRFFGDLFAKPSPPPHVAIGNLVRQRWLPGKRECTQTRRPTDGSNRRQKPRAVDDCNSRLRWVTLCDILLLRGAEKREKENDFVSSIHRL